MADDTTNVRHPIDSDLYQRWKESLGKTDLIREELERLMREDLDEDRSA